MPDLDLTPAQEGVLHAALMAAFPKQSSLEQMVAFHLGWLLNQVAGPGNLRDVVFEVLREAKSRGAQRDLVNAACATNPSNERLRAFCTQIDYIPDTPGPRTTDHGRTSRIAATRALWAGQTRSRRWKRGWRGRAARWP